MAASPPSLAHRPVVMGRGGMVVAGHHRAAEAGAAILRAGGNAIDASVATAATLAVAIPFMNGLGGDAIALYAEAPNWVTSINGSGAVARSTSVEAIRARGHAAMPMRGPCSVTVPGLVAALGESLERFGTLPFAQLLEPAIALAEEGVPADAAAVGFFNGPVYAVLVEEYPALARMFGPPGGWALGRAIRQPALAQTLRTLAREGWRAFYEGPLARAWLGEAQKAGVFLDEEDLSAHGTLLGPSLSVAWRGRRIHAAPPNSQGLALLGLMGIAAARPTPPPRDGSDPLVDPLSFLARKRRAFEMREAFCADPRRIEMPANLLEPASLARIAYSDGSPRTRAGGGDTSTFVVIDREGRAVSWVQSLFEEFGSGIACPEQGIVLHNRAGLETLDDDPVHGLRAGLRPFHTLCPALAFGPGDETIAIATPGDHGQPQAIAQVLHRHIEQGLDIQAAIEWPRLRHDVGGEVMLEDRCPASWDAMLEAAGWTPRRVGPWSRLMGGVNAIVRRPDGLLMGGADPRRSSYGIAA